ncbi:MAG: membrane protein insertase YidC [Deltaproteobacteria bacterium]|nr:membrane protein insertase YidC [Deltaproteobacteria bacterium]
MEKRVILALVLSLAVLFLYQMFIEKWIAPPPVKKAAGGDSAPQQYGKIEEKSETIAAASLAKKAEPVSTPQYNNEIVTIETSLYKALFFFFFCGIKSWQLKGYRESLEPTSSNVDMIASGLEEYPLQDNLIKGVISEAIYFKPSKSSMVLTAGQTEELIFTWVSHDGVKIEKKYTLSANRYNIQGEITITNTSADSFEGRLDTSLISSIPSIKKGGGYSYHNGAILYADGNILRKDIKEGEEALKGKVSWIGLEDMYFISAIIPKKAENALFSTATTKDLVKAKLAVPLSLAPGAHTSIAYTAYIGPKEMDILTAQRVHLEDSINLGWFTFLAKPLLVSMNFLYKYIPNYGLVIILLTVIIKILFHPLTKKGLDSMKEMQKIQPQIVALRERYKDDKEKMNRELMELYKRYKINPLGGCLPMVLQIPVFIALYNVLGASIELRHAPFMLWINDLSAPDRLLQIPPAIPFVGGAAFGPLPLLMGATMLIQQKMTPSTMDPTQAKMMLIMPVIFTFMFLNFPSGLVLYWLINNVLSIAQQYYIQKTTK